MHVCGWMYNYSHAQLAIHIQAGGYKQSLFTAISFMYSFHVYRYVAS